MMTTSGVYKMGCNFKLRGALAKSAARVSNVCDFVTGSGNLHVCLLSFASCRGSMTLEEYPAKKKLLLDCYHFSFLTWGSKEDK